MTKSYDLLVIGTGTAAMTVAMKMRGAGRRVAVVDFRVYGGTCALRGCDPKKMLIGGVEAADHVRRSMLTLQRCAGVSHPGPQDVASICSVAWWISKRDSSSCSSCIRNTSPSNASPSATT